VHTVIVVESAGSLKKAEWLSYQMSPKKLTKKFTFNEMAM